MKKQRDFQRTKVYRSEWSLMNEGLIIRNQEFETLADCMDWIKENVFPVVKSDFEIPPVKLKDGRGSRRAFAYEDGRISLPKGARNKFTIIHEFAHLITPWSEAAHGELFCSNYLMLLRKIIGDDVADRLEQEFTKNKVKY